MPWDCASRAGGDVHDLKYIYDVSWAFVYKCVWLIVDAINKHIPVVFPFDDEAKLKVLEAEFAAHARKQVWRADLSPHGDGYIGRRARSCVTQEKPLAPSERACRTLL